VLLALASPPLSIPLFMKIKKNGGVSDACIKRSPAKYTQKRIGVQEEFQASPSPPSSTFTTVTACAATLLPLPRLSERTYW